MSEIEGASLKEHVALLRDALIFVAVWFYFIGFIYMYYYFRSFDVSPLAMTNAPQSVLMYAYNVLSQTRWQSATMGFSVVVTGQLLNEAQHHLKFGLGKNWRHRVLRVGALALALGAVVGLCFWLGFGWAMNAARHDVAAVRTRVGSSGSNPLNIIEIQSGSFLHSTKEFEHAVYDINQAGELGKAAEIAQSDGDVYFLVAKAPNTDVVYAIPKSGIMVVTTHKDVP